MLLRSFESFEKTENGYLIHGDAADVKLVFMTDDIIRIRVHFDKGTPMEEESYTLVTTAWGGPGWTPGQGRAHPHHRAGRPLR